MTNYDAWKLQEPPDSPMCGAARQTIFRKTTAVACFVTSAIGFYALCRGCARLEASGL